MSCEAPKGSNLVGYFLMPDSLCCRYAGNKADSHLLDKLSSYLLHFDPILKGVPALQEKQRCISLFHESVVEGLPDFRGCFGVRLDA